MAKITGKANMKNVEKVPASGHKTCRKKAANATGAKDTTVTPSDPKPTSSTRKAPTSQQGGGRKRGAAGTSQASAQAAARASTSTVAATELVHSPSKKSQQNTSAAVITPPASAEAGTRKKRKTSNNLRSSDGQDEQLNAVASVSVSPEKCAKKAGSKGGKVGKSKQQGKSKEKTAHKKKTNAKPTLRVGAAGSAATQTLRKSVKSATPERTHRHKAVLAALAATGATLLACRASIELRSAESSTFITATSKIATDRWNQLVDDGKIMLRGSEEQEQEKKKKEEEVPKGVVGLMRGVLDKKTPETKKQEATRLREEKRQEKLEQQQKRAARKEEEKIRRAKEAEEKKRASEEKRSRKQQEKEEKRKAAAATAAAAAKKEDGGEADPNLKKGFANVAGAVRGLGSKMKELVNKDSKALYL